MAKIQRNAPCPCGSGLKYKRCCWGKADDPAVSTQGTPATRNKTLSIVVGVLGMGLTGLAIWARGFEVGLAAGLATIFAVGATLIFRNAPEPRAEDDHPASINFGR